MFCFPSMLERDPNARHLPQVNIMAVRADTMFSDTVSTRFSLGLFQRALCPLGALMCPLVPPQNQPIFNSHLNYLNLKTVWALSIELSEH